MRFFFQDEILVAEQIGGCQSAHSSAQDSDVVPRRGRGFKNARIAHLVANVEVFAVDHGRRRKFSAQGNVDRAQSDKRPCDHIFDERPAVKFHLAQRVQPGRLNCITITCSFSEQNQNRREQKNIAG